MPVIKNKLIYKGYPLTTPEGYNVGTICVIDSVSRELNKDQ